MSLLTQFYPGPGGGGGGVGSYPGIYASDPISPTVSPSLFISNSGSNGNCPDEFSTSTFNAYRMTAAGASVFGNNMAKIVDYWVEVSSSGADVNGALLTTIDGFNLGIASSGVGGTSTFDVSTCPNLTSITGIGKIVARTTAAGQTLTLNFSGCKLDQTSVDAILVAINAGKGPNLSTRVVNIAGGTNSTPGAAGLVAKAALVADGWTVTNN